MKYLIAISFCSAFMFLAGGEEQKFTVASMEQAASERSVFVGSSAPAFELQNQDGESVSLAGQRGKWLVLYFYPKDDTPGCACQATEFTGLLHQFRNMNAEVFGVSEDSPTSHRKFIKKYDLKLTLLSDSSHEVMRQYGAWTVQSIGGKSHGRTIRSTFIIDPKGVIKAHYPEVFPRGHAERVREKLAKLQIEKSRKKAHSHSSKRCNCPKSKGG